MVNLFTKKNKHKTVISLSLEDNINEKSAYVIMHLEKNIFPTQDKPDLRVLKDFDKK